MFLGENQPTNFIFNFLEKNKKIKTLEIERKQVLKMK